jgi:hypothetical protein
MMTLDLPEPAAIHWIRPQGVFTPIIASVGAYENVSTGCLIRQLGEVYIKKIKRDTYDPKGYLPFPQIDELKSEIEKRSLSADLQSKYNSLNNAINEFITSKTNYNRDLDYWTGEYKKWVRRGFGFIRKQQVALRNIEEVKIKFSKSAANSLTEINNIINTLPIS